MNRRKKEKLFITGLNGLIGWHLFLKAETKFRVTGTFAKDHPVFRNPACVRLNLDDEEQIQGGMRTFQPDYVIHARAICDLDLCESMPAMAERINVEGTKKLIRAVRTQPTVKKFVYISTDHVFDGNRGGYTEKDEPNPKHVYGRSKLKAEKLIQSSGFPSLIIRPGLVIGRSFQGNKGPRDFLFSRIRAKKPTHLFTDEWRTTIDAGDLAARILALMVKPETGIYHLAGSAVCNRYELGRKWAVESGLSTRHIYPRERMEDAWAPIRPADLSLASVFLP